MYLNPHDVQKPMKIIIGYAMESVDAPSLVRILSPVEPALFVITEREPDDGPLAIWRRWVPLPDPDDPATVCLAAARATREDYPSAQLVVFCSTGYGFNVSDEEAASSDFVRYANERATRSQPIDGKRIGHKLNVLVGMNLAGDYTTLVRPWMVDDYGTWTPTDWTAQEVVDNENDPGNVLRCARVALGLES